MGLSPDSIARLTLLKRVNKNLCNVLNEVGIKQISLVCPVVNTLSQKLIVLKTVTVCEDLDIDIAEDKNVTVLSVNSDK